MNFRVVPYFNVQEEDGRLAIFARPPGESALDALDALEPSAHYGEAGLVVSAESAEDALEVVFAALNVDTRPNGYVERSLSVGDVLHVPIEGWFAVAPMGFDRLCGQTFADPQGNACVCLRAEHEGQGGHRGLVTAEAVR